MKTSHLIPILAAGAADARIPAVDAVTGGGWVCLVWPAVAGATKYKITAIDDEGTPTVINAAYTNTQLTITGLTNGTEYIFLVQSYVSGKWSSADPAHYFRATPSGSDVPPPNPVAVPGDTTVTLTWSAVEDANRYAIVIYYSADNYTVLVNNLTETTYTAEGLTNGETYPFLVQARTGSKWSPANTKLIVSATPAAPVTAKRKTKKTAE